MTPVLSALFCLAAGVAAPPAAPPNKFVAHEWGTFTSFSGSDGVPVGFNPDNSNLPEFVYREVGFASKDGRLSRGGTVSLETPVVYFYAGQATNVSVKVDFPKGWVTEWYPAAARGTRKPGVEERGIRWDVRVLPGDDPKYPTGKAGNAYFSARETDAAPLEVETDGGRRGDTVVQREKFLFYRGVGTFPPPVTAKALGGGKVRVTNSGGAVSGLVLVSVKGGKVGFRPLPPLAAGADSEAAVPEPTGTSADLADHLTKELTAAGLYPKEAKAMVKTWSTAWFGEDGTRLMYLVPRPRTDELLPLTLDPKPSELVRVLVGRHEFLTPERETEAMKQIREEQHGDGVRRELKGFGRFAAQARAIAEKRLRNR